MKDYRLSYPDSADCKGLYYLHPSQFEKRQHIIELWRASFVKPLNAYQTVFPILVPTKVLVKSEHLANFKDQLYKIQNKELYLRPQTAQSIFPTVKTLLMELKAVGPNKSLTIGTVGRAFRLERSTREGAFRKRQFEQMQLETLVKTQYVMEIAELYRQKVQEFLTALNIAYTLKEPLEKPHYSKLTWDLIALNDNRQIQIGCINFRGNHDIGDLGSVADTHQVLELSLGLDRILLLAKV